METNASQSWANGPKLEVQTGRQEKILHLQNSAALEMVIRGGCQISSLRGSWDSAQAKLTWCSLVLWAGGWTGDFQQPLPRDISTFYDKGLVVPAKFFAQTACFCGLLVSAFPSFKVFLLSPRFHRFAGISLSLGSLPLYQIALKIGEQIQKTLGEIEREKRDRKTEMQTHSLSLSFQRGMITHFYCFAPTKLCHRADRHRPVHAGILVLSSMSLTQRYEGTKPPFIFPPHVWSYSPAHSFSWGTWCQLCQT